MSAFKFTPLHPRQNNSTFDQYYLSDNTNFNNQLNNNFSNNYQQNYSQYQDSNLGNNYLNLPYQNNNFAFNANNNIYNTCYILINGFDKYTKELLINFMEQKEIITRNIKFIGNDKIIIKFQNQNLRNDFVNEYNKVKGNFYGVVLQFIDENEKDRIINNNANRVFRNISYSHNFMDNNTMMQLPRNKSNFQKFLDVFLNL